MIAGLIVVLVAVMLGEFASAKAEPYLDIAFYAGVAMSLVGAALVALRAMSARRTA
jgi:uncharacterized membrane protein